MHTDSRSGIVSRHLSFNKRNLRLEAYNTGADQRHNESSEQLHGGSGAGWRIGGRGELQQASEVPAVSRCNGNSRQAQFKERKGRGDEWQ